MTGQGWVRAGEAGPEVGAEGAGQDGEDTKLSRSGISNDDDDEVLVVLLSVEVVWVGTCTKVSTQLATLESKVDFFLNL